MKDSSTGCFPVAEWIRRNCQSCSILSLYSTIKLTIISFVMLLPVILYIGSSWYAGGQGCRHSGEHEQAGKIGWQRHHEIQESECKVLYLGNNNPMQQAGDWLTRNQLGLKGPGGLDGRQAERESRMCHFNNESQPHQTRGHQYQYSRQV